MSLLVAILAGVLMVGFYIAGVSVYGKMMNKEKVPFRLKLLYFVTLVGSLGVVFLHDCLPRLLG